MELIPYDDGLLESAQKVYKHSSARNLGFSFLFLCVAIGLITAGINSDFPLPMAIFSSIMFFLLCLLSFNAFLKSLRKENWVLAIREEDLLLNFHSYLKSHEPRSGLLLIKLLFRDIDSAKSVKKIVTTSSMSGGSNKKTENNLILSLGLKRKFPGLQIELEKNISKRIGHKKSQHYFVSYKENELNIVWRDPYAWVTPDISSAINLLKKEGIFTSTTSETQDLSSEDISVVEQNIIDLNRQGKVMEAIILARKAYDFNLTEAKSYVSNISEKKQ